MSDDDDDLPKFTRTWQNSSVRRPTTLPDPNTYHEYIDIRAIFELQETDSSDFIHVVPHRCTRCIALRQFCSRFPPCDRCRNTGRPCLPVEDGYQNLPPPKVSKGGKVARRVSITEPTYYESSDTCSSSYSNSRVPKKQNLTHTRSVGAPKTRSKRKRDENKNGDVNPPQNVSIKQAVDADDDTPIPTAPNWKFLKPPKTKCANDSTTAPPRTPRVWANSRTDMAALFPRLTKSGFSSQQFDVPALFVEHHPFPKDAWIGDNTLEIILEWAYICAREALVIGDIAPDNGPSDNTHTALVEQRLVEDPPASFSPITHDHPHADVPPLDAGYETLPCNISSPSPSRASTLTPILSPTSSPDLSPQPNTFPVPPKIHTRNIPEPNPPEIETLVQCRAHGIPLLVFVSQESGLLPQPLPAEYACSCLGFFFISDLNADRVMKLWHGPQVSGRVRWRLTLEWAPGGEMFVGSLENNDERMYPWWTDPVHHPEKDIDSAKMPYRPRNLDGYFSYLPLDLLADFKPSEVFPRGWYCLQCGMLNAQRFFRHQICQSSLCKRNANAASPLSGHADPLEALRDPQHLLRLLYPLDVMPLSVSQTDESWDDGMRTLTYDINDCARVRHIFTGNQDALQKDATNLLAVIQKDIILDRSNLSCPYFMWSRKLDAGGTQEEEEEYENENENVKPEMPSTPRGQVGAQLGVVVSEIQDVLLRYMQAYGEIGPDVDTDIDRILIQAWVTPGSKRGTHFKAKSEIITIVCLGAEVVLNLVPEGGFAEMSTLTSLPIEDDDKEMTVNEMMPIENQGQDAEDLMEIECQGQNAEGLVEIDRQSQNAGKMDMGNEENDNDHGEHDDCDRIVGASQPPSESLGSAGVVNAPDSETDAEVVVACHQAQGGDSGGLEATCQDPPIESLPGPSSSSGSAVPDSEVEAACREGDSGVGVADQPNPASLVLPVESAVGAGAEDSMMMEVDNHGGHEREQILSGSSPLSEISDSAALAPDGDEAGLMSKTCAGLGATIPASYDVREEALFAPRPASFCGPEATLAPNSDADVVCRQGSGDPYATMAPESDADVICRQGSGDPPDAANSNTNQLDSLSLVDQVVRDSALSDLSPASGSISIAPLRNVETTSKIKKARRAPSELSITLVHGDAIILEGDDFSCQIKRSGTTILLIGSCAVTGTGAGMLKVH